MWLTRDLSNQKIDFKRLRIFSPLNKLPGYDAFMILLFLRAQKTVNIAALTKQRPKTPSASPDIHEDVHPLDAGSVLQNKIHEITFQSLTRILL